MSTKILYIPTPLLGGPKAYCLGGNNALNDLTIGGVIITKQLTLFQSGERRGEYAHQDSLYPDIPAWGA